MSIREHLRQVFCLHRDNRRIVRIDPFTRQRRAHHDECISCGWRRPCGNVWRWRRGVIVDEHWDVRREVWVPTREVPLQYE